MREIISAIILLLLIADSKSQNLFAQEGEREIITDRPDITESAIAVPQGYLQIENGFQFENKKINIHGLSGEIHNYNFSSLLFRYGLLKSIELRLGANYLFRKTVLSSSEYRESGISDILAGTKFQLLSEDLNTIDLGIIVQLHLPVGNEVLIPKGIESELLIAFAKSINDNFSFSGNAGAYRDSDSGKFIYLYSGSLGIKLNNKWEAFAEIYGNASGQREIIAAYDFGFSYKPVINLQLDFSLGTDSFTDINEWLMGAGISIRLPN